MSTHMNKFTTSPKDSHNDMVLLLDDLTENTCGEKVTVWTKWTATFGPTNETWWEESFTSTLHCIFDPAQAVKRYPSKQEHKHRVSLASPPFVLLLWNSREIAFSMDPRLLMQLIRELGMPLEPGQNLVWRRLVTTLHSSPVLEVAHMRVTRVPQLSFAMGSPAIRPSGPPFDSEATAVLSALLKGPLVDDNVLVALDTGAQNVLDLNQILFDTEGELLQHDAIQRSEKIALLEEGISNKTRFENFDGAMLYLGSWCDDFPFLYPVGGGCAGISLDLLDIMAKKLNFTYDVQMETADHKWGSKENGTWTGMLGDLVYNSKDLVVNYFLATEGRSADFDSTYAYYSEGFGFALKNPLPKPKWPGLLYPFSGAMWLLVLSTVAFTAFLLTVFLTFMPEQQKPGMAFLLIMAGVVNQSVHYTVANSWSRLYTGWWWLCALIITCGYTSNLIAFLTVPVFPTRIETVDQLAASGLRVCMQDYGNFLPEALKVSTDPSLYKLGHNLDLFPYAYLSFEIGFSWVLNNTHAVVDTYSYLVYLLEHHNHTDETYMMKEHVYPGYLAWFLKMNCPFTNVITNALQSLVEAGLVDQLYTKHMSKVLRKDKNPQDKISEGKSLQLAQLLGAFMLLGLGVGVASIVFVFEYNLKRLT
ncbi:glutamate receptor ionotropic, delta-2-like [Macrobrachium rosenbergii]|uniref:glutamate receptor ionotropic, delta-2-like n=1 Tax=Macrobrachium rosenbergii TaxID=79674 RepID=UPI0034D67AB3